MKTTARIAIISPALLEPASARGGGIEDIDYRLARGISRRHATIMIGPFFRDYHGVTTTKEGIEIREVRFPALRRYPFDSRMEHVRTVILTHIYCAFLIATFSRAVRERLDVVVVHNGLPGLAAAILARIGGARVIVSEGNTNPWVNPYMGTKRRGFAERINMGIVMAVGKLLCSTANRIRVQSDAIREGMIRAGVTEERMVVIPAGVELLPDIEQQESTSGKLRVGFVGRLVEEKGAQLLLEIVKQTEKELPNVEFTILGDGEFRSDIEKHANVTLVGWVNKGEVRKRLAQMDIVLFFQRDLGLAEFEAMETARAIVAWREVEPLGILRHMDTAVLCEPNSTSYVNAIDVLLRDPQLRRVLGHNARHEVEERFAWDRTCDEWMNLMEDCIRMEPK